MEKANQSLAKTVKPNLSHVANRGRLYGEIDNLLKKGLWVSGPAGSGKTTLITSYIDFHRLPHVWYRADPGDNDLSTFFYYLRISSSEITSNYKELPLFTPEHALGLPVFSRRFFEVFFKFVEKPAVLVFDNVHEIEDADTINDVFLNMFSALPNNIHVIFISRKPPPASLSRLLANDSLAIIGWPTLRFTNQETQELAISKGHGTYPEEQIQRVNRKADGWAAGIQLILQQADFDNLTPQELGKNTPEQVFDYFAFEVFRKIDRSTKDFLKDISVFPLMTLTLVEKLTGSKTAGKTLQKLHKDNFFTDRHSGPIPTFQFHPLFREFLYKQLQSDKSNEYINQLTGKAANLLNKEEFWEQALELYFLADDEQSAAGLILRMAPLLISQGRNRVLFEWIEKLSDQLRATTPWLLYWQGVSIMPFSPPEGKNYFSSAHALFHKNDDPSGVFLSLSGLQDSIIFSFDNYTFLEPLLDKTTEALERYQSVPDQRIEARITASMLTSMTFLNPTSPIYAPWMERGLNALKYDIDPELKISLLIPLVWTNLFCGDLHSTRHYLKQFQELTQSTNASTYSQLTLWDCEAVYHWLTAQFDSYREALNHALELEANNGVFVIHFAILGHALVGHLSMGELHNADKYYTEFDKSTRSFGDFRKGFFHFFAAQYHYYNKRFSKALHHSGKSLELIIATGSLQPKAQVEMVHGVCLYVNHQYEQAATYLQRSIRLCRKFNANQALFDALLASSTLHFKQDHREEAFSQLKEAMELGRQHGYLNTWFWRPDEMATLCARALEANITPEYATQIIRKRNLSIPQFPIALEKWPWPLKIFTMGRFSLLKEDQPLLFKGKPQKKPLALIKVVIALGGRDVDELEIQEALWPDKDGDAAHNAFSTAVYRLRKLVNHKEFLKVVDGKVTLDRHYCWVDLWRLEQQINQAWTTWNRVGNGETEEAATLTRNALSNYKGHFLASETEFWVLKAREKIRKKLFSCLLSMGDYLQSQNRYQEAIMIYQRGLDIEPLSEELYQNLIRCQIHQNQMAESHLTFKQCKKALLSGLGLEPSQETKDLLRKAGTKTS